MFAKLNKSGGISSNAAAMTIMTVGERVILFLVFFFAPAKPLTPFQCDIFKCDCSDIFPSLSRSRSLVRHNMKRAYNHSNAKEIIFSAGEHFRRMHDFSVRFVIVATECFIVYVKFPTWKYFSQFVSLISTADKLCALSIKICDGRVWHITQHFALFNLSISLLWESCNWLKNNGWKITVENNNVIVIQRQHRLMMAMAMIDTNAKIIRRAPF